MARLLRLDEVVSVRVPTESEEAARDLVRAREATRTDLMRSRHRLSKLLLRRGIGLWERGLVTTSSQLLLEQHHRIPRTIEVATAYLSEPRSDVVAP